MTLFQHQAALVLARQHYPLASAPLAVLLAMLGNSRSPPRSKIDHRPQPPPGAQALKGDHLELKFKAREVSSSSSRTLASSPRIQSDCLCSHCCVCHFLPPGLEEVSIPNPHTLRPSAYSFSCGTELAPQLREVRDQSPSVVYLRKLSESLVTVALSTPNRPPMSKSHNLRRGGGEHSRNYRGR